MNRAMNEYVVVDVVASEDALHEIQALSDLQLASVGGGMSELVAA